MLVHLAQEGPFDRMSRELRLTDAQQTAARQAMDQARAQIDEARREFDEKRQQDLAEAYVKVRSALNSDQQQVLDRDFVPASIRLEAQKLPVPGPQTITAPAAATNPAAP